MPVACPIPDNQGHSCCLVSAWVWNCQVASKVTASPCSVLRPVTAGQPRGGNSDDLCIIAIDIVKGILRRLDCIAFLDRAWTRSHQLCKKNRVLRKQIQPSSNEVTMKNALNCSKYPSICLRLPQFATNLALILH